ncbi:MAG: LytTR family transcriptional regulator [Rhodobacteraceae bacterium]|nr:LytTR family transcriptional regulator [Paracoccaceae bacterium]MAY44073.1 LytTR family transcriptional regulator [Paracoccaceae bacterium]
MTVIAGIGFSAPWLLLALLALPVLWLILRAVPPAPIRRRFPGVALLLGLTDDDTVTDRTPWWLLLLRILAVAAVIIGLAGPVLNPQRNAEGSGPLLIVMDGSWAGATRWVDKTDLVAAQLAEAGRANRPVAILRLTAPEDPVFQAADSWRPRVAGLTPEPFAPTEAQVDAAIAALDGVDGGFDTHWISDGLDYPGRDRLVQAFRAKGALHAYQTGNAVIGLAPAVFEDGAVTVTARRSVPGASRDVEILAQGRDPSGTPRTLASATAHFDEGSLQAEAALSLPSELRARVTRFEVQGQNSAGATSLTDDSLRRREVALISGRDDREGLQLLSPLHYLHQALLPTAELLEGALTDLLPANPDVVVLADVATLSAAEEEALQAWVEDGGMLLRFAGPRLAASDVSRSQEDPLMPVRLREGGRSVGGAMSWGEPKGLAPFAEGSPFYGLQIPDDVKVNAQVMAQPDPTLADRVIASLADGTPLVTRKQVGQGQVVLFHVTANAEWSTLPLSGLFVQMLERLAVSSTAHEPSAVDLEGTTWTPVQVLDGHGDLIDAGTRPGVEGPALAEAQLGPELLPGLYQSGDRRLARNVIGAETMLTPAIWPADVPVEGLGTIAEKPLGGILLTLALAMLIADILASLGLSGRLRGQRAVAGLLVVLALGLTAQPGHAQLIEDEAKALRATDELVLAHVITGDARVDDLAQAGLQGLSDVLRYRTSVEPGDPEGVNLETDELAFYPLLYWPITPDQPQPSDEAYARLNDYLRSGGLIVFDTRDADVAGFGASSPNGRRLQQLAAPLDIPPLEPIPHDHVLTRTFYLLQDFPGRYAGRDVWVEAAPPDAEQVEGMPFRNLNDGVTPVIIGGNDWAGAWAVDADGRALLPVGRGFAGERQRELANRFGVNLVMHVLTGNYKSDQVHVPALLDRLGQ